MPLLEVEGIAGRRRSGSELLPRGYPINDRATRYYVTYGMGPDERWFIDREEPRRGLDTDWRYIIYEPGGDTSRSVARPCAAVRGHARTLREAVEKARALMRECGLLPP